MHPDLGPALPGTPGTRGERELDDKREKGGKEERRGKGTERKGRARDRQVWRLVTTVKSWFSGSGGSRFAQF